MTVLFHEGAHGCFDFAFIDADKPGYAYYFECGLDLIPPGRVMIFDQRVMSVDVVNAEPRRKYTASVQTFNEILLTDQRVEVSMLPVSDGVTMVRVRYI